MRHKAILYSQTEKGWGKIKAEDPSEIFTYKTGDKSTSIKDFKKFVKKPVSRIRGASFDFFKQS